MNHGKRKNNSVTLFMQHKGPILQCMCMKCNRVGIDLFMSARTPLKLSPSTAARSAAAATTWFTGAASQCRKAREQTFRTSRAHSTSRSGVSTADILASLVRSESSLTSRCKFGPPRYIRMAPLYSLRLRLLLHSVPSRLLNPSVRLRAHHSSDTSRLVRTLCAHHDPCRPRFASSLATIPRSSSVAVLRGVG